MSRFLLVAPIYAASLLMGGGQRTFHISRAVATLGEVDLVLVTEPAFADLERTGDELRAAYPHVSEIVLLRSTEQFFVAPAGSAGPLARAKYFFSRMLRSVRPQSHFYRPTAEARRELAKLIDRRKYAALVGRYLKTTALSGAFAQRSVPVLVDLDDLEDKLLAARLETMTASSISRHIFGFQLWQVRSILQGFRNRSAHLFTASERDRQYVDMDRCSVLPNIPFQPTARAPLAGPAPNNHRPVVLFVGSHGHGANRDGVERFIAKSWPAVHQALPGARLRIVGSGGWEGVRTRLEATKGVEVVGTVEDLGPEYAAATLSVVPIDDGSGTKIKVLESLLHSRPVLASSHSAHGYEELVGRGIVTASGGDAMSEQCVALLRDPAQCVRLAAAGHNIVAQRYSPDAILDAVISGLVSARVAFDRPVRP